MVAANLLHEIDVLLGKFFVYRSIPFENLLKVKDHLKGILVKCFQSDHGKFDLWDSFNILGDISWK